MSKARNDALAGMTKAELIKTIKALDRKQTALLNELAKLKATHPDFLNEASFERACEVVAAERQAVASMHDNPTPRFPWDVALPNAFEGNE